MQLKLLGIGVIAFGLLWLLINLGLLDVSIGSLIGTYWPVFIILWGADHFRRYAKSGFSSIVSGLLLLGLGALILGRNMGLYEFDFSVIWKIILPLFIIFVGWALLRGPLNTMGGNNYAILGSLELKKRGWKLESGNILALMGGADIDLTVADIPDWPIELNLTAIMGGIEVRVPDNIALECEGTALLGGVEFIGEESGGIIGRTKVEQSGVPGADKKIIIRGTAIMGGIQVKH